MVLTVCTQSEIWIFRTLVVRYKHTWSENLWHTVSLHMQYFQLQTKNFNETPKYWLLILAGCKYISGPAKFHLQPCQTYVWPAKGGLPVMAEITRILAANIPRQFFFVITTTASTRCLVENFQLICYSQRVNATSQYNDSGSSRCSKWPKDRMVAVVKHCWVLVQGKRGCRER